MQYARLRRHHPYEGDAHAKKGKSVSARIVLKQLGMACEQGFNLGICTLEAVDFGIALIPPGPVWIGQDFEGECGVLGGVEVLVQLLKKAIAAIVAIDDVQ